MKSSTRILAALLVAAFAVAAGILAGLHRRAQSRTEAGELPTLPAELTFNDLSGQPHRLDEWRGKLVLVNFWASWCGPCLQEIPRLMQAQKDYAARGFQLVGAAADDPDAARAEARKLGIAYPVLVGTPEAMIGLMTMLGNEQGGLPFSVFVGADGRIFDRILGPLNEHDIHNDIEVRLPR